VVRELALTATVMTTAPPVASRTSDNGWRHFGPPRSTSATTLFAMKEGTVLAVTSYRREQQMLSYVLTSGAAGTLDLRDVDWAVTTQLNQERGVRVALGSGGAAYH
jgi:hypothetical protein